MCSRAVLVCLAAAAVLAADYAQPTVYAQSPTLYEGDACKQVAEVEWTCKKIKDCTKAQDDVKRGLRPETCSFDGNEIVVCCEPSEADTRIGSTEKKTTKKPRNNQNKGKKSKQMCEKYAESVYLNYTDILGNVHSYNLCAIGVQPLITNGTPAQPREFPHMALIGYGDSNKIQWKCGGSLISERWVLSAAHCSLLDDDRPKWVRLGEYNVGSTADEDDNTARSQDFDIIEIKNHPQYDNITLYNDIALYKLNRDVEFSEYIRPICLQTEYRIPKTEGLITGWGRIAFRQRQSDILLKGNVTFITRRKCKDSLKQFLRNREIRDNKMICAGNSLSDTDTCQGDSGGPLQYQLSDPFCMYSQVGITSFGYRCGFGFPSVFTRVSYFVPWIESIVWP